MKGNGVTSYTKGSVVINFPGDDVCCQWCPMLNTERVGVIYRCFCKRTGEFIPDPVGMIGQWCPIEFENYKKLPF